MPAVFCTCGLGFIPQALELYTGMRMGEINALRPGDIDFEKNVIHIRGNQNEPQVEMCV